MAPPGPGGQGSGLRHQDGPLDLDVRLRSDLALTFALGKCSTTKGMTTCNRMRSTLQPFV